jgi:retinol dehydrogenase 12
VLEIYFARSLTSRLGYSSTAPIINTVNPGFCTSDLRRDVKDRLFYAKFKVMEFFMARKTEIGARTLVHAAVGGEGNEDQLRGAYLDTCQIMEAGDNVVSIEGKRAREVYWVRYCLKQTVKADADPIFLDRAHRGA